ncbi:T9SS type A sorting domain-containing protein [Candidatus Marinimicrobia bacterium MT.SAG.2]|nr:T9SS type A sorting domain-containing protein [Candidatus Marinimicrobia bacterium MT.SAG.2]
MRDSISSVHKAPHAIALGDFDENGLLDFITANRDDNTIGIFLNENYPNPFNPSTTIEYTIPQAGNVSLIVYNLLGEEVTRLVNEIQQADKYNIIWDASNFLSGIYFCRLQAGEFVQTNKMLLMK